MKVILVDDDALALEGITHMLHWDRFGGELVGCATNGQEAVALLHEHHPDVVISDIRMPVMDGLELAKYIFDNRFHARMILLSGHSEFEYAQRALHYQVTDYILKPITRSKLNHFEERLIALQKELNADSPPWCVVDETLRARVGELLRRGDMASMAQLLISQDVSSSLSDKKDMLGIQLLNYLFIYQEELGKDRASLDALRQKAMTEYWKLTTQQERLSFLAAQYYDLMEYAESCKGEYTSPIVSYCLQAIQKNYSNPNFNISNLADSLHLSLSYLSTVFKNATGQNLSHALSSKRLSKAQEHLKDRSIPIKTVCDSCGYDDPRYFAKIFKKHTGMTPSEFRNLYSQGALTQPSGEEQLL